MTSARKMAVFMLFAMIVTGCQHKTQAAPPVAAQAPPLPPKPIAQVASLPPVPAPETPKVGAPGSDQPPPPPPTPPKRTTRHKPKPATPAEEPPKEEKKENTSAAGTTQQAAAGATPETSPIGQLSTTGESSGTQSKRDILEKITKTEKGLSDIKRSLSPEEQETVTQIRTFLTKARQALNQDDLDGAQTLVTKATVLLDELTKT
jgi:ribosomal protein S20